MSTQYANTNKSCVYISSLDVGKKCKRDKDDGYATVATTTISVLNSKLTQNIHTYIHISPTLKKKLPG